jgi:hypothetical protein
MRFIKTKYFTLIHSWLGVISAIFILSLVLTGIILNNPDNFKSNEIIDDPYQQYPKMTFVFQDNYFIVTRFSLFLSSDLKRFKEISIPFSSKYIIDIVFFKQAYWIGLSNGLLFKMDPNTYSFERILIPDSYELYSVSSNQNQLFITTNQGGYEYKDNAWFQHFINRSPWDFWEFIRSLHTGYLPHVFFKKINTIVSVFLLVIILTGIVIFFKKYRFMIDKNKLFKDNET